MPIENRNLKPGDKLVGRYHKQTYKCEVVEAEGGKLHYRLEDGREFKSPSAAGMAITGKSCNGWAFWSMETASTAPPPIQPTEASPTTAPSTLAPEKQETEKNTSETQPPASTAEEEQPTPSRIFRTPNQKGVPSSQVRWYCHECSKSFSFPAGQTPATCPKGHKAS